MVSGGMSCIKYLLFAFNLVFFLIGLTLIIIGSLVQAHLTQYTLFLSGVYGGGILVIVLGAVIFVIAFFGCCGAIRENQCMMRTFGVFLTLILILEIVAAILGFVFGAQLESALESGMVQTMPQYTTDEQVRNLWNDVQTNFKCCGVINASDWQTKGKYKANSVPDSCCVTQSANCGVNALLNPKGVIYTNGCVSLLEGALMSSGLVIGIVALCFAGVQVIGILFACCLASAIKKEYELV